MHVEQQEIVLLGHESPDGFCEIVQYAHLDSLSASKGAYLFRAVIIVIHQ
jgi:hypothetical protein